MTTAVDNDWRIPFNSALFAGLTVAGAGTLGSIAQAAFNNYTESNGPLGDALGCSIGALTILGSWYLEKKVARIDVESIINGELAGFGTCLLLSTLKTINSNTVLTCSAVVATLRAGQLAKERG